MFGDQNYGLFELLLIVSIGCEPAHKQGNIRGSQGAMSQNVIEIVIPKPTYQQRNIGGCQGDVTKDRIE